MDALDSTATRAAPSAAFLLALGLITFVSPLCLHLFFPAAPAVKAYFAVDDSLAQLAMSGPMFVMAFLTLVYGTVSDRVGRRRVLLAGLAMFLVGSVIAALAPTIWFLVAGRLIQGAGGACGMVFARVIARDVYGTERLVRVIAYLTMAYTIGPLVAPFLGGWLTAYGGWRAVPVFAVVAGLGIMVLAWGVLYETHGGRAPDAPRSSLFGDYWTLLRNPVFVAYVSQSGASSGAFFAMATGNAYLMNELLHRPAEEYGLWFLMFPAGFITGNFISGQLGGRIAIEKMVLVGGTCLPLTAIGQAILILTGHLNPWVLFVPGGIVTLAQGVSMPNAQTGAMRVAGDLAGTAAGVAMCLSMLAAAAFTQLYGLLADGTPVPLIMTVGVAAAMSFTASLVPISAARRARR